jgi:hypothetical protein
MIMIVMITTFNDSADLANLENVIWNQFKPRPLVREVFHADVQKDSCHEMKN